MTDALTTTIPGRNLAFENLGHVLVLGLGVSGRAVVDYLVDHAACRVESITVYAGEANRQASEYARSVESAGVTFIFDSENVEGNFDLCIVSPGIPQVSEFYQSAAAASSQLISEVEFAYRESASDWKWVGVTGSNGKTTTTSLIAHILSRGGYASVAVGNIGDVSIGAVKALLADEGVASEKRVIVCELSSYQLASISDLSVDVAVILGITPDHLSWHGSFEEYAKAKFRLLENLSRRRGVAVLDAVNDVVRAQVRKIKGIDEDRLGYSYIPIGAAAGIDVDMRRACGAENAAFVDDDELIVAFLGVEHRLGGTDALKLKGVHNQMNALAASACGCAFDIDDHLIAAALREFAPLEHRIEPVATIDGIEFFNDSKATNVDSTLVALASMDQGRCIVMLGGRDKGTALSDLVDACARSAKGVVCFGEAGERFYDALDALSNQGIDVVLVDTFDHAFEAACEKAVPGDSVLLSPACASFDEFSCFEERGKHFKDLVRAKQHVR